jgi:hypothetical protein
LRPEFEEPFMTLSFSDRPGPRERHLRRKYRNPLFADSDEVTLQDLIEARRQDLADADAFRDELLKLVEEAASLPAQADSEVVLGLKERLDKAYERACGLTGDQSRPKQAIQRLLGVIMRAVRNGAGSDSLAHHELDEEEQARRAHFELLEQPLIADLLSPDNPIPPDQLARVLLSESQAGVEAALSLFEPAQLELLCAEARLRVERLTPDRPGVADAQSRLELMERQLAARVAHRVH